MKKLAFFLSITAGIIFSGSVQAAYFQGLGHLPGGHYSDATEISDDGLIVVGRGDSDSAEFGEAFRWTQAEGMVGLGCLPDKESCIAYGVSNDGQTIVGAAEGPNWSQAFLWNESSGMVGLGFLGCPNSCATGISGDGSVVVGYSDWRGPPPDYDECDQPFTSAFLWTEGSGMVLMGDMPVNRDNDPIYAHAISNDGSVVVGGGNWVSGYDAYEAFRWTESSGMVGLGDLPGGDFRSYASGVSGDGSVVVGTSRTESTGDHDTSAFLWNEQNGMQRLEDVLTNCGVDLNGWILLSATDVSADGKTIVGYGLNPDGKTEAWIANISKISIDNILNFFDESIPNGTLTGDGPGNSANGRLNALRNMLEMAGDLIEIPDIEGACVQLKAALGKCDGDPLQPDFVTGPAAIQLSQMIEDLMESLGCE